MFHANPIITVWLFIILSACSTYLPESEEEDKDESGNSSGYTLQFSAKSNNDSELNYPISIYIFNENNQYISQTNLLSTEENCSVQLPGNKYTITALSGINENDYQLPSDTEWQEYIRMTEKTYANVPLQRAHASINLNKPMSVNFTFLHTTAAVYFTFSGVPSQVTGVEVNISPVCSGISLHGEYSNDRKTAAIPCQKTVESTWTVGPIYVFPHQNAETHLSVSIQTENKNEVYSYTYPSGMQAGYPYHFSGKYGQSIDMDGSFQIEGWEPTVEIEFDLNENTTEEDNNDDGNDDDNTPETPEGDVIFVTEMPEKDTIWGPFYVWEAQETDNGYADVILIAPDQYYALASEAALILEEYERDDFRNWRTFTKEEAESFRNQFFEAENLESLNNFITAYGLDRFYLEDARYLCNELQSTFCFTNKRITAAGEKTEYYLRPVKKVRLKLK